MILRDLKKIKLTNTHKGILGGLGLLALIVGFAYFFYPVVEGYEGPTYFIGQAPETSDMGDSCMTMGPSGCNRCKKGKYLTQGDRKCVDTCPTGYEKKIHPLGEMGYCVPIRGLDCDKNFGSFTDKYKDFKIVGSWAPRGFVVYPYKFNDTVVFIGKDDGYYKMIGYNFCNSPEGERITGRALWDGRRVAMNPQKMTSDKVRDIWKKAGASTYNNVSADKYGLTKSFISGLDCDKNYDSYKKFPTIYGSYANGSKGVPTRYISNVIHEGGKKIYVYTGLDGGYWKMVGYDFCETPPRRIDGRAVRAKKGEIDISRRDAKLFGTKTYSQTSNYINKMIPEYWNNPLYKNTSRNNYNLRLERK